MKGSQL